MSIWKTSDIKPNIGNEIIIEEYSSWVGLMRSIIIVTDFTLQNWNDPYPIERWALFSDIDNL